MGLFCGEKIHGTYVTGLSGLGENILKHSIQRKKESKKKKDEMERKVMRSSVHGHGVFKPFLRLSPTLGDKHWL